MNETLKTILILLVLFATGILLSILLNEWLVFLVFFGGIRIGLSLSEK